MVEPATIDELAAIVADADRSGGNIIPTGAGTRLSWGGTPDRVSVMLSTRRLSRIIEHAAGDMTATVEAGVTVGDLQRTLADQGQYLAVDAPPVSSIGGMIAVDDSGSWRYRLGGVRDLLIGVTLVRPDGAIAKAGGKVVKNVAGYDLAKLLTGSFGTLGCIVSAIFRLHPLPEAEVTLACLPSNLAATWRAARALPASGLAIVSNPARLLIRFSGLTVAVESMVAEATLALQRFGDVTTVHDSRQTWADLVCTPDGGSTLTARIGVLPANAPAALAATQSIPGAQAVLHGNGQGWVRMIDPAPDIVQQIRSVLGDGVLVALDAPSAIKPAIDLWSYQPDVLRLMRRVQRQFDPHGTFCPERLFPGADDV